MLDLRDRLQEIVDRGSLQVQVLPKTESGAQYLALVLSPEETCLVTSLVLLEGADSPPPVSLVLQWLVNVLLPVEISLYLGEDSYYYSPDSNLREESLRFFGPDLYRDLILTSALHTLALATLLSSSILQNQGSQSLQPPN